MRKSNYPHNYNQRKKKSTSSKQNHRKVNESYLSTKSLYYCDGIKAERIDREIYYIHTGEMYV